MHPNSGPAALEGDDARHWFLRGRGRANVLDAHLIAVHAAFGAETDYTFVAPIEPDLGQPTVLIVEVQRPVDDYDAQLRLDEVQSILLDRKDYLAEVTEVRDPFQRIAVVLSGPPRDWDALRAGLDAE